MDEMRKRTQELRKNATQEENTLWYQYLRRYPIQFKRQYQMGPYIVDFYCYRAKLVVELDGSRHCEPEVVEYDRRRTAYISNQGFLVLRISNLDIKRNLRSVCEAIDQIAKQRCTEVSGSR